MLVRVMLPRVLVIRNHVADWHIREFANNGQGQQDAKTCTAAHSGSLT